MNIPNRQPTAFESLAGGCQFTRVAEQHPAFYTKHHKSFDFSNGFLFALEDHPPLGDAIFLATTLDAIEGGQLIKQALQAMTLSEDKLSWIDQQMNFVMDTLLPVVLDPELPESYSEAKWAIRGAFNEG